MGILGLENHVLKTVTLSSTLSAPSFTPMHFEATPIVRVALEAKNIKDMPLLKEGMRLLSLADPCVEVCVVASHPLWKACKFTFWHFHDHLVVLKLVLDYLGLLFRILDFLLEYVMEFTVGPVMLLFSLNICCFEGLCPRDWRARACSRWRGAH